MSTRSPIVLRIETHVAVVALLTGGCGLLLDLDSDGDSVKTDAGSIDADAAPIADASLLDAALPDVIVDAGPAAVPACDDVHSDALFCDGFEEIPEFARWGEWSGGVSYVETPVRHGRGAMRASLVADVRSAWLKHRDPMPIVDGELFLRAHFFVPTDQPTQALTILRLEEGADPWGFVEVRILGADLVLRAQAHPDDPTMPPHVATGFPLARDRWVCIELRARVGDEGADVEMFVDEASRARLDVGDSLPAGGFLQFYAAVSEADPGIQDTPSHFFMDEVVFSKNRIGCADAP